MNRSVSELVKMADMSDKFGYTLTEWREENDIKC